MKNSASSILRRWPLLLATLTALIGAGISVSLQNRIAQTESTAAKLTAETLRLNTEQELTLFADVLESVCALHAISDAVDQAAMDEFVEKGLVYPHKVLGPFGLTQRINPWLRADIERKNKDQPGAYQVVQPGPGSTWVPAEFKSFYYPLTWQSRANGLKVPIGFDFASLGEEARRTIDQIERTRRPALVPAPIRDPRSETRGQKPEIRDQTSDNPLTSDLRSPTSTASAKPAYWVFAPVIPGQVNPNALPSFGNVLGFSVAVLHPESILDRVAALTGSASKFRMTLRPARPESNPAKTIRRIKGEWLYSHSLEAIGTHWRFECSLPVSVTGYRSTTALTVGLIITALMTSLLLLLAGQTRKIEAEVRARTEDLRIANVRLEQNLHERAQLEEQIHELAAIEQRRIGRDLHDSLGQKLTGAVFLSRSLLNGFQKTEDRDQRSEVRNQKSSIPNPQSLAQTLNDTLKAAVAQVRNMARGLAPVTLNDESLCESLEQLAEEMTGMYGVSCEIAECTEPAVLERKSKEQLYLIAREAVNNAARHALAGRITLQLTGDESGWTLCIKDDGKGLPETPPDGKGMGIRIMRHRAGLIGASFAIVSDPDQGTCVNVTSIS